MKQLFSSFSLITFFLLSALFFVCNPLTAQNAQAAFPSLEPAFSPQQEPSSLSGEAIIRAALDFSLCPRDSAAYTETLRRYRALEQAVCSASYMQLSEEARAEAVLTLMYETTLSRYSLHQSRMDRLFSEGTYNCVSSSALYAALATACGIRVRGNVTRDHAFCTVYLSDGAGSQKKIDVETTNPNGFNPGTKKPVETKGGGTAYFIVPKKSYNGRVEVSVSMLTGAIGRNMVSDFNEHDDYAHAVPLAAARFPYAQTAAEKDAARADFDVVSANYALFLDHADRSARAVDWLEAVYTRYGKTAYLEEQYDAVAYNAVAVLVNAGNYTDAAAFLDAHRKNMKQKSAAALDETVFLTGADAEIRLLSDTEPDTALLRLRELRADSRAQTAQAKKRFSELTEYAWYQKARPFFDQKDYFSAARTADEGLSEVPQSRNLQNLKKQALQNHAVGFHNRFAELANSGNLEEAKLVIEQGLKENPANTTLQNDLRTVKRMMGQ